MSLDTLHIHHKLYQFHCFVQNSYKIYYFMKLCFLHMDAMCFKICMMHLPIHWLVQNSYEIYYFTMILCFFAYGCREFKICMMHV